MSARQIELFGAQFEFVACPDRFTAFIGGIGSGKSYAGAAKALVRCAEPGLGLVVAPTYPMLRDATWRSYQQVCAAAILDFSKSEFIARIGAAEVLFRSADEPEHLRGPNISWAHIDEGALCHMDTWPIVIGRLRADGKAGPAWVTSTPKGRNWLYNILPQVTIFKAKTRENPYLAREFVESLEGAYSGQFARQELEGEFVSFEGLVYEEFRRDDYVRDLPGPWAQVIAGVDEGYTNPSVILAIGIDGDGRAYIIDEFYRRRVLQADVVGAARSMAEQYKINAFYADPSAAGLIAEMVSVGLPVMAANHDVMPGIQVVKSYLARRGDGRSRLAVSPRCVNTIAEFESYQWKQGRQGMKDEPEKMNDHAMDALRYGLVSLLIHAPAIIEL
mgnify:CR=1 FL=1